MDGYLNNYMNWLEAHYYDCYAPDENQRILRTAATITDIEAQLPHLRGAEYTDALNQIDALNASIEDYGF